MITEALVAIFVGLVSFLGNLMPDVEVPAFVGTLSGLVSTITGYMAPMGHWVPFAAAGQGTVAVLAAMATAVLIWAVRFILSLFTGGGGT